MSTKKKKEKSPRGKFVYFKNDTVKPIDLVCFDYHLPFNLVVKSNLRMQAVRYFYIITIYIIFEVDIG